MKASILYIFTRTPLHVGAGSSVGAIDQPVQRERHTGFPIIPGSSIKGVMRDHFTRMDNTKESVADIFGPDSSSDELAAGKLSFGEARLLTFPVRSAKGAFALATSPLALNRLARDLGRRDLPELPDVKDMHCYSGSKVTLEKNGKKAVVLEEYKLDVDGDFPVEWAELLASALADPVLQDAPARLVLLSDGDLSHYAMNACQVQQHVSIDSETGVAARGKLFNEETVPSETLFYATLTVLDRGNDDNPVSEFLKEERLFQFGGDGTTGLGFCSVKLN